MAAPADATSTNLLYLERELVCFICTEILYQPITVLDCLHPFCGTCLKEWFTHQRRKAVSSHSSSSSSNPYTCPTCRAPVKDVQLYNALVNTFLDMFLSAYPDRQRSEEEKQEIAKVYKPGDNIIPKIEGRRRERRTRREEDATEVRERRMVEEARERSLRDLAGGHSSTHAQDRLQPPASSHQSQSSRSRERQERRERRREQERQEQRQQNQVSEPERAQNENVDTEQQRRESLSAAIPSSSPRHPEAVEARQRQQTVVHQASLVSLISSSEGGTGSSNSDEIRQVMQEIMAEDFGFLQGVDVEALPDSEQEALAERVVEAYRQRCRDRQQRSEPSVTPGASAPSPSPGQSSNNLQVHDRRRHQRTESGSRQQRADTMPVTTRDSSDSRQPRTVRTLPSASSNPYPPTSSVTFTHRRRASSQGQHDGEPRARSRQSSPGGRSNTPRTQSTADATVRARSQDRAGTSRITNESVSKRPILDSRTSAGGSEAQLRRDDSPRTSIVISTPVESASVPTAAHTGSDAIPNRPRAQSPNNDHGNTRRRTSAFFEEPSIKCFRCHRADIQYDVYRHCDKCDVDLCLRCYRAGSGCNYWFGFRHAAMPQFEALQPSSHEQTELPHTLYLGRRYTRPEEHTILRSKLAKDGTTVIPLQTTSNPTTRMQEGCFCDRCGNLANSCFWLCDHCNYGEWGFCRDCVNTHHCCTHPLLPTIHKSCTPASQSSQPVPEETRNSTTNELLSVKPRASPVPSQPSSAASALSMVSGPLPDFIDLPITTNCDLCSQPIALSAYRFHCPFHKTPTAANPNAKGDYDICTPCYQNLIKTNSIKRDDGSAGWRKCPDGHLMIITTFSADNEGGQRRVVINDLVGGRKLPEEAMKEWNAELESQREQGNSDSPSSPLAGSPEGHNARRLRARTGSWSNDPLSLGGGSPYNSSSKFPPDGGSGLRGIAIWSYFPEPPYPGAPELSFPRFAEIREIKIHEAYPDWFTGVYAGDVGLVPAAYVRYEQSWK